MPGNGRAAIIGGEHLAGVAFYANKPRTDLARPDLKQTRHEGEPLPVRRVRRLAPIELRGLECGERIRVGNPLAVLGIAEGPPPAELVAPALAHLARQLAMKVGEEAEGMRLAPLLAHEEQRDRGAEQQNGGQGRDRRRRGEALEPLAERAVADLVVVLQAIDEGRRRQPGARLAAPGSVAERRGLALVDEALRERARELGQRGVAVSLVVAVRFARRDHVGGVMEVVVPLARVELRDAVRALRAGA